MELTSPFWPSKNAEYRRSIELFEEIYKTQGAYFALAFLYDSGYEGKDLKRMMDLIHPKSTIKAVNG